MIHPASRGIVCLTALRPVPNVTWPPGQPQLLAPGGVADQLA